MKKVIKHTTPNGVVLTINCAISFATSKVGIVTIRVSGEDTTHEFPHMSSVERGTLYLNGCACKGETLNEINSVDGLQEWYDAMKANIKKNKQKELNAKIQEDKKIEKVEFPVYTVYGTVTENEYLKSLGFNNLNKKQVKEVLAIAEQTREEEFGDYDVITYYVAPMDKIVEVLKSIT